MLKIKKIEQIKADITEEKHIDFQPELTNIKQIEKLFEKGFDFTTDLLSNVLSQLPSIGGKQFALIYHHAGRCVDSNNLGNILHLILYLIDIPHDLHEVRWNLKNTHKVDPILFIALLWKVKNDQRSLKCLNLIVDCYPVEIMLNGKPFLKKWNTFIEQKQNIIENEEKIKICLSRMNKSKGRKANKHGFEQIYIPL